MSRVRLPKREVSDEEYREAYYDQENLNILHKVANKYRGQLEEDQSQECIDRSLWRALQYHDNDHPSGQRFTTSLFQFASWEFNRELAKKKPQEFSSPDLSFMPSGEAPFACIDLADSLEKLAPDQKNIIHLRYYDNKTLAEIAADHGYSKETARQRLKKAEASLREILEDTV